MIFLNAENVAVNYIPGNGGRSKYQRTANIQVSVLVCLILYNITVVVKSDL